MTFQREAILRTFLVKTDETLHSLEETLISLESRPDDEDLLHGIFRDVHRLKGDSILLGLTSVSELAHVIEDLLDRLRSKTIPLSSGIISLLLRSVDVLRGMIQDIAGEQGRESERLSGNQGTPAGKRVARQGAALGSLQQRSIRVDTEKLDRILNLTGEIAIGRDRLQKMLENPDRCSREEILEAHRGSDGACTDLKETVMKARMVPLGPTFRQYIRAVRDLAMAHKKVAELVLEGEDVEVDTSVVENLKDPITHIIRNSVDHGIESQEERRAKGKDPAGSLVLRAYHEAGTVVVQLSDDGAGLNRCRILERARAQGLIEEKQELTDQEIVQLIFRPGFTTADSVTDTSGRGVGMDIVRRNVEALRGSVSIETHEGQGTKITIRLPLTLAIIQGLCVGAAGETYIVPIDSVVECLDLPRGHARDDGTGVIELRGSPLPYVRLREVFGFAGAAPARENIIVVEYEGGRAGIAVDALYGESQAVIKPLMKAFHGLPGVAGAAIQGDGRVALILDVPGILRRTLAERVVLSS